MLRKLSQRVLVGDRVMLTGVDWLSGRGVVDAVLPRTNLLTDPPVANVDHVLLALALDQPAFEEHQATRFLLAAESSGVPFSLLVNKADLLPPDVLAKRLEQLAGWGYPQPLVVSCRTGRGVAEVLALLRGKTSVVTGPSGAGKSSLINAMRLGRHRRGADDMAAHHHHSVANEAHHESHEEPHQDGHSAAKLSSTGELRFACDGASNGIARNGTGGCSSSSTSSSASGRSSSTAGSSSDSSSCSSSSSSGVDVSDGAFIAVGDLNRSGRGTHTTTSITLVPLPGGGLLADTPGYGLPQLDGMQPLQLAACFPEFALLAQENGAGCRFSDCLHCGEPGCVVSGRDMDRLPIYHKLLAEVQDKQAHDVRSLQLDKRQRDGTSRVKASKGGGARVEAKLNPRKHRAASRGSGKLALREE